MRTWPTALVVDDHEGFRAFARLILESAGFTVTEAATGAEAASAAAATSPRLVLLDIQLPDTDGFEVARRLTAAPDQPAQDGQQPPPAPVIVLTSTREASDYGGRIAASPAAGFLPKDQLSARALRAYLDGGRNSGPP
jgi:CheY-like chemotaxis protein